MTTAMTDPPAAKSKPRPGLTGAGLAGICLLHALLLLKFFGGLGPLLSNEPLLANDHGWHFYYSVIGARFFLEHGTTWGYDPYLMAGYPTDVFDLSDRLLKVGLALGPGSSPELGYKMIVFLTALGVPLLFFAAAWGLGLSSRRSLITALIGFWVWWIGGGLAMFSMGMTGFGLASLYGLFLAGLFARHLRLPSTASRLGLLLCSPVALLIHPGILPIVLLPAGILYVYHFRRLPLREHLFFAGVCLFSAGANFFWIQPGFINLAFSTSLLHAHFQDPLFFLGLLFLMVVKQFQLLAPALPVAAVIGLRAWRREGERVTAISLGASSLLLFGITAVGGRVPGLQAIQPSRYGLPLLFFLALPAAVGFEHWWLQLFSSTASRAARRKIKVFFAVMALSFAVFVIMGLVKAPARRFVGIAPKLSALVGWLRQNTDRSARVLLEDNGSYTIVYEGSYAAAAVAYYSGREIIGGPHWATHLLHHRADLSGFFLFGRRLGEWNEDTLRQALDLYNIGWAGAATPPVRDLFQRFPALFQPLAEVGGFQLYAVNRPHTFFLEGRGQVSADYNRLTLSQVATDTGRVVLSYHWHPCFQSAVPGQVFRVTRPDDPVGFIGIRDPGPNVNLEIKYWERCGAGAKQ